MTAKPKTSSIAARETKSKSDFDNAKLTSHSLIARVKDDDPNAWRRMVDLYSPLVYFWCQESGLPQHDLNDVFQEVFHSVARHISKFHHIEKGTFRGWLRTLTRNKLNDHFRKRGRNPNPIGGTTALQFMEQMPAKSLTGHAHRSHQESEIHHTLLRKALDNIRGSFADQTWKAFWMVVVDGRETINVAKDLSMKPGTVRVAKSRVLKSLRLEIGDIVE
ncbi:RNA polymerase sigma factor [Mariniblastus fucicola]|uniref:ECF RNA polymerase sigma factor SigE n=1 Tax=Mariniblastus fucicola TaxID=980251 RepID=A0A5B9PD59_9BACT|nr:sigma-70 family RNA polymerase sigma factor [Mariniblastus fucicola]QEG23125.1 ECF RNA polymerase sigma factor SigE [Mariniblastus fucicola]